MLRVANRITILLAVFAVLFVGIAAYADYGAVISNNNDYMMVQMGEAPHADCDEPDPADPHKDRVGRWGIWSLRGDPETTADDNFPLIRPARDGGPGWHYGYTTIRVGNEDGGFSDVVYGDPDGGGWRLAPYASAREVGNYIGYPVDSFHSGSYVNSQYVVGDSKIFVQFRLAVIRDQARLEVYVRNDDSATHSVGIRHCVDALTDQFDGMAYPFIPGRGIVQAETSLTGNDIPEYFELYNDPRIPTVAVRMSLKSEDATPPDRVAIGDWFRLQENNWDYLPIPDRLFSDSGWALWWDPVSLAPGESRTMVTYVGMAAATSSWTSTSGSAGSIVRQDPFCVAIQAPRALPISYDPNQNAENMLQSNPFLIKAYIYNLYDKTTLTNINMNLTLPPGLQLVTGEATQSISNIGPETECSPAVWEVKSDGSVSGELKYFVSVSGTPGLQKTVARSIILPATSTTAVRTGWQMISVPFKFSDPQLEQALDLTADTFKAYTWNPQSVEYDTTTTVTPGKSFWLKSDIDRPTVTIARDARPLSGTESYRIVLYTGWNQFGNPYLYPIPWGRVKVLYTATDSTVSVEEAAQRNWIRRTIHWWDADAGEYFSSSDPLTNLLPWQGYWIKAMVPCQLIIPWVEQPNGSIGGSTTRSAKAVTQTTAAKKNGWNLKLVAKAGNVVDSNSVLGVDSRAADSYDALDVENPPSHEGYVSISFPHKDWGANSDNYKADIRRSASQTQTWQFDVKSDLKNTDVVLTWPNIVEVPKNCRLKLVDVDANVTKYVRTTSSYTYNTGDGTVRRFKLVAEPNATSKLVVMGLAVSASRAVGGASISYNLSDEATSDVVIKNTSGRVVRTLAKNRSVTRGINSLSWNYRNEAGDAVPAGSYLVEVVATTPDGEIAKSVRPFLVAR